MPAELSDLLRLLAVPVLGWAAYRDVLTRRVPSRTRLPLLALGTILLLWDGWRIATAEFPRLPPTVFGVHVAVSVGLVVPLAYLLWRLGGFGGADAKALMTLAILFPSYPIYAIPTAGTDLLLPLAHTPLGAFSLTILTNTVLLAGAYPVFLAVRNLLTGDHARIMAVGQRASSPSFKHRHGRLLETPEGFTRGGLDLDALRMYLRWRDTTLEELRADPDRFRDPASVPAPDERHDPGDGALGPAEEGQAATDGGQPEALVEETTGVEQPADVDPDDEWGAEAFLADVGWGAWGTEPEDLRAGLEVLATREAVWYSPGIPFLVPTFLGLVLALTYGDLLFGVLAALGLA